MHLGPEAMRLIGEGIAHDIAASNDGSSWFAHDIETIYEDKETPRPLGKPAATLPLPTLSGHVEDPHSSAPPTAQASSKLRITQ